MPTSTIFIFLTLLLGNPQIIFAGVGDKADLKKAGIDFSCENPNSNSCKAIAETLAKMLHRGDLKNKALKEVYVEVGTVMVYDTGLRKNVPLKRKALNYSGMRQNLGLSENYGELPNLPTFIRYIKENVPERNSALIRSLESFLQIKSKLRAKFGIQLECDDRTYNVEPEKCNVGAESLYKAVSDAGVPPGGFPGKWGFNMVTVSSDHTARKVVGDSTKKVFVVLPADFDEKTMLTTLENSRNLPAK